jgi:AcrR family transcriptional regulator
MAATGTVNGTRSVVGNARGRRTRQALVSSAADILRESGVAALTMNAVVERAGVTRKAVYLHFANRGELLAAVFQHVAERAGFEQSLEAVWRAPSAREALDEWARHLARYHTKMLAADRALVRARDRDPDADAYYRRVIAGKRESSRRLAEWLQADGVLNDGWDVRSAADMLYALISSELIGALVEDRGWSQRKLATQLAHLFRATFTERPVSGS